MITKNDIPIETEFTVSANDTLFVRLSAALYNATNLEELRRAWGRHGKEVNPLKRGNEQERGVYYSLLAMSGYYKDILLKGETHPREARARLIANGQTHYPSPVHLTNL